VREGGEQAGAKEKSRERESDGVGNYRNDELTEEFGARTEQRGQREEREGGREVRGLG
jgi:hypothetical protein